MKNIQRPINSHSVYHAHVYFEQETLSFATTLCERINEQFNFSVGRIHQRAVGPHPKWSCQITFVSEYFEQFIPWLEANRQGLTIFIHPLSGNDLADHSTYAYWLGDSVELDLSMFR